MRKIIISLFALLFIYSCTPQETPMIAEVFTGEITSITTTTASCSGNVTSDGGFSVAARGICWNTSESPTISDLITIDGTGLGSYNCSLTSLLPNTTYYVRAYATNSKGTAYGEQRTFTTNTEYATSSVTTGEVTNITTTTASCSGNVTSDGGSSVTARGVCWSTSQNPTVANTKTTDGTGRGTYTSNLSDLLPNTTYYVRAYTTNAGGTAYGEQKTFTTLTAFDIEYGSFTDSRDGNEYKTVTIGSQVWMAENLKYLPEVVYPSTNSQTTACYYVYGYEYSGEDLNTVKSTANYQTYGVLYNWPAAMTACPEGWHLPSDSEWQQLTDHLGGEDVAGGKMKEEGINHWANSNTGATNESGFTTLPGGCLTTGFFDIGYGGYFWSSSAFDTSKVWFRYIINSSTTVTCNKENMRVGYSVRCVKGVTLPTVSTERVLTYINSTTVDYSGRVISDGGSPVTARGVCWSTSQNPTLANTKTTDGIGPGIYTSNITGLSPNITYYVRAYAINSEGTVYGEQKSFRTFDAFTDSRDGHVYKIVTIGSQVWMAENLAYLPEVSPSSSGSNIEPYYYVYDYQSINPSAAKATTNYNTYGALYNWPAAMAGAASSDSNPSGVQGICPTGWHLPSDAEWTQLENYLGGWDVAGGKMKEAGTTHWYEGNNGDNTSGFTALPGSCRTDSGAFINVGYNGYWWSSTESIDFIYNVWFRYLGYGNSSVNRDGYDGKEFGLSVRCVRDSD